MMICNGDTGGLTESKTPMGQSNFKHNSSRVAFHNHSPDTAWQVGISDKGIS